MLKKMTLLAMAVGALIAFAAPAIAQAEWYTDVEGTDVTVGTTTETGDTVELTGELSWTKFPVRIGPCPTHVKALLWNTVGVATGEVESSVTTATTSNPCQLFIFNEKDEGYTAVTGCGAIEVTSALFPWHITTTLMTTVNIGTNYTFTFEGCGLLGIPNGTKLTFSGTATGNWSNGVGGGCINYNNNGDLVDAGLANILLDGSVCKADLTFK